jgi:voltage-gated potassium channel
MIAPLDRDQSSLRPFGAAVALLVAAVAVGFFLLTSLGDENASEAAYRTLGAFTSANIVAEPDSASEKAVSAGLAIAGGVFYLVLLVFGVREVAVRRFSDSWRDRQLRERIEKMHDHFVVCGYGNVGAAVVSAFLERGQSVVVVDVNTANLERAKTDAQRTSAESRLVALLGDASQAAVLEDAGVGQASALVACVGKDGENLFIALTAKLCNPTVRVIARATDDDGGKRLSEVRDKIDSVWFPYRSAGREIVQLALASESSARTGHSVTTQGQGATL